MLLYPTTPSPHSPRTSCHCLSIPPPTACLPACVSCVFCVLAPCSGLNEHVTEELAFEFHYFFTRKFWMLYHCQALVVAPGGFGTLDELFEVRFLLFMSLELGIPGCCGVFDIDAEVIYSRKWHIA